MTAVLIISICPTTPPQATLRPFLPPPGIPSTHSWGIADLPGWGWTATQWPAWQLQATIPLACFLGTGGGVAFPVLKVPD